MTGMERSRRHRATRDENAGLQPIVYVVEDDADLRSAVATCLRSEGYQVLEARDGAQLLGHWPRFSTDCGPLAAVDVVVTDQRMPGATGLELLADIRHTDWATPVILMSAFVDEEMRVKARRLGAAAVLSKPFNTEDLIDTVQRVAPASS